MAARKRYDIKQLFEVCELQNPSEARYVENTVINGVGDSMSDAEARRRHEPGARCRRCLDDAILKTSGVVQMLLDVLSLLAPQFAQCQCQSNSVIVIAGDRTRGLEGALPVALLCVCF